MHVGSTERAICELPSAICAVSARWTDRYSKGEDWHILQIDRRGSIEPLGLQVCSRRVCRQVGQSIYVL